MKENKQKPLQFRHRGGREISLWVWLAVIGYMILVDNLLPSKYEGWAIVAGWFGAGILCLVNFNSCGRYHCKITGPGFLGLGILALLETIGVISNPPSWITWTALFVIVGIGVGLEYRYKLKNGTYYT